MIESIGKYRILRELGKGATATVYLAEDPDEDRKVAVKLVRFKDSEAGRLAHRVRKLFEVEGRMVRQLDHPNIVRIYDYAVADDQAYIVMEYVDGRTLDNYITFDKLLPVHEVVGIIFKCCLALDHAFKQGIVHRDIKPSNIMVDGEGNVKITDFGLALDLKRQGQDDSTFIMGVGSPAYMSPEQIKEYPLDQKTDLYSLGVVFFEMLTGRLPFRGANRAALVYKIINADPPRVSVVNPSVPAAMDRILQKSLEKDLYSRYRNGAEMAKDLAAVRYQILDDSYLSMDTKRYAVLRKLPFFLRFGDVELWEALRISKWRLIDADTILMREGDEGTGFGIIVEGKVEISLSGKRIGTVGAGEAVGETAYLNTAMPCRATTVTTLTSLVYLEINPAALGIATEECREFFQAALVETVVKRMALANEELTLYAPAAHLATKVDRETFDLELAPLDTPGADKNSKF